MLCVFQNAKSVSSERAAIVVLVGPIKMISIQNFFSLFCTKSTCLIVDKMHLHGGIHSMEEQRILNVSMPAFNFSEINAGIKI